MQWEIALNAFCWDPIVGVRMLKNEGGCQNIEVIFRYLCASRKARAIGINIILCAYVKMPHKKTKLGTIPFKADLYFFRSYFLIVDSLN